MKKEESGALQGIAVLLMIFHHCFLYSYMFLDGFLRSPEFTTHFARSTRIAIAICAFVSGYGIYHVLRKKNGYREEYKDMCIRIAKLYGKYWIAVLITILVDGLIFGSVISLKELPGNLTGFNPTYNTTWWYIREYMFMLLIAPFIKSVLQGDRKRRTTAIILIVSLAAIMGVLLLLPVGNWMIRFLREYVQVILLIIFFEGYLAAFIQDRLKGRVDVHFHKTSFMLTVGILTASLSYILRYMVSFDGGDSKPDIIIAPIFILGAVLIFRAVTPLRKVFAFLGSNLLYMWFIHGLIWKEAFVFLTSKTTPVIYYTVIVISSLLISVCISTIEKAITGKKKKA